MKFANFLAATALSAVLASPMAMAGDGNFSDADKQALDKIIHDYLVNNPEVLIEASQALQQKQQQSMQENAKAAILENATDLFSDPMTVSANPKGSVTVVEFFDYQCSHCKKMAPVLAELTASTPELRIVYKEFPIFGKSSEQASRAALAAAMQGKYLAMHDALLQQEEPLNDEILMKTANSLHLNMAKFKTDMNSPNVTQIIDANRQMAEKLHLMGTPAFIIASTPAGKFKTGTEPGFIPGAASKEALEALINKSLKD